MTTHPSRPTPSLPDRRHLLKGAAAALAAGALPLRAARAQNGGFPAKPITVIVPVTAGGLLDSFMRGSAKLAQPFLNDQPIVIENRPGAQLLLGADAIARVPKGDGYLLTQFTQILLRAPHMRPVHYDPMLDFTWIIEQVGSPFGVAVRTESPYRTLADLIADGRSRPGAVSYATVGVGNGGHLMMEELARLQGVGFNLIPVKGSSEAIQGVLGGHIDCLCDAASWAPHVASGKMRLLVQFGEDRLKKYPSVPSAKESGIPLVYTSPIGLLGPKKMDPQVVQVLHDAFRRAGETPAYRQLLDQLDLFPLYRNSADFAAHARDEYQRERTLVQRLGLQQKA